MLDLFIAADFVREQTKKSLAEATAKPPRKRDRRRPGAVRSSSAAALRGLADLIEPSRTGAVHG